MGETGGKGCGWLFSRLLLGQAEHGYILTAKQALAKGQKDVSGAVPEELGWELRRMTQI